MPRNLHLSLGRHHYPSPPTHKMTDTPSWLRAANLSKRPCHQAKTPQISCIMTYKPHAPTLRTCRTCNMISACNISHHRLYPHPTHYTRLPASPTHHMTIKRMRPRLQLTVVHAVQSDSGSTAYASQHKQSMRTSQDPST
jgi:hypothetical protein